MSFTVNRHAVRTHRAAHAKRSSTVAPRRRVADADDAATRLKNVIVPLDGSEFAEHAIPLAMAIAKRSGGILTLIRVFTPSHSMMMRRAPGSVDMFDEHFKAEARHYLADVRRRVLARSEDLPVLARLVDGANVARTLSSHSANADLVVMATRGRSWLHRLFFGSVSREMLREHRKPIIYVRGYDSPVDFSADPAPRHVLLPLDGKRSSEQALVLAGGIARVTTAQTTMLHVEDPDLADSRFPHSHPLSYLSWARDRWTKGVPRISTHVVRNTPDATHGILAFTERYNADLIAVTSRSGPPAWGSTASSLIRKSKVPVLVIREEDGASQ